MSWSGYGWRPYVPVAERRAKGLRAAQKALKKGQALSPIVLEGKTIAKSFWGKAWCDNLESYSDYENRLPRGRTYVRGGMVIHLDIKQGEIEALVSGSDLYKIKIAIKPCQPDRWKKLCAECSGQIGSLIELLQGRLSGSVMEVMTRRELGLFPSPDEISMECSCPDWADMCKHLAAVMYGVGSRLDEKPELLFLLRHVDHTQLVEQASSAQLAGASASGVATVDSFDVAAVFGIELDSATPVVAKPAPAKKVASNGKKKPALRNKNVRKKKAAKTPVRKTKTRQKNRSGG